MPREQEVHNAANPRDVHNARQRERNRATRLQSVYLQVMATPAGRAVMWDLIGRAGVFESPWSQYAMEIHRNIGRSDFGKELLADLCELDEKLFLLMETEGRVQAKQDEQETRAAHVAPATQQGENR